MNITYIDLEIGPIKGTAWGSYKTNLLSIDEDAPLLSVAYKINDGPTQVASRRLYSEKKLTRIMWNVFNDSDVIVAQNGDGFDIRVANTFFIRHGFAPPAPYRTVDTLKIARKYFRFASNKLDYIAKLLLRQKKLSTGMDLWFACMRGEEKALRKMERYNVHDVNLLYEVYHLFKGWHTGHPNSNLYNGTTHRCPTCGGKSQKRGFNYTRVGKYQRYQCQKEGCYAWWSGEKINTAKPIR